MNILENFPNPTKLKQISQSLAVLDAIISPEWESRHYSFNAKWAENEQMASMRDGQGSEVFIVFNNHGAILKGYNPNEKSKLGELKIFQIPQEFKSFKTEPAFSIDYTTFIAWNIGRENAWNYLVEDQSLDAMKDLLEMYQEKPALYCEHVQRVYNISISTQDITKIFIHEPLTDELIHAINSKNSIDNLKNDIAEIGYP